MISRCRRRRRKEEEVERKMGKKSTLKAEKFPLGSRNPENQASKTSTQSRPGGQWTRKESR